MLKFLQKKGMHKVIEWVARLYLAFMFLFHGAIALTITEKWFPMFTTVGIPEFIIPTLLVLIGILDLTVGLVILLRPYKYKIVLLWCAVWPFVPAIAGYLSGKYTSIYEISYTIGPIVAVLILLSIHWTSRR